MNMPEHSPEEKRTKEKTKLRNFHLGRALRLVWESAPRLTVLSVFFLIILAIFPIASLYLMKLVIDEVVAQAAKDIPSFHPVATLILLIGVVIITEAALTAIASIARKAQSQKVTNHITAILHEKSVSMDLKHYENPEFYNTMHRAQQQSPGRPTKIVNGLTMVGQSAISLGGMIGLLFILNWGISLLLFIAVVPGVLVKLKYSGTVYHWERARTSKRRLNMFHHWILTTQIFAKEIRLFGFGPIFVKRYKTFQKELNKEELGIAMGRSFAELGAKIWATASVLGAYTYISYRTVEGDLSIGEMVMFFGAFQRGLTYIQKFLTSLAGLYEDNLFLTNFYEFMDMEPTVTDPPSPLDVPSPMSSGISLSGVSFTYPGTKKEIISDINMHIKQGEHVALVGENGAGKTSLIKLLCRLYDPTEGSIRLDDHDLRQFRVSELRSQFSLLFQDYAKYPLTARENIWLGDTTLDLKDHRIEEAAAFAGAAEVIESLEHQYETVLGRLFEGGQELSVGQWQKVALARAFLRNAQVVILDEPSSALDARAEYELFQKFHQMVRGRTAIFISHRLSTVRMVDRIFVMDKGRIAEHGTHDELIARNGIYAMLFEMQAEKYR